MFLEAVNYLSTPCKAEFRKLGYLRAAIALEARYQRLAREWQGHIQHCQQLVRMAVEQCPQRRKLIVLGSGLTVELPLDYLAECFDTLLLVDVVHTKAARNAVTAYNNIELLEADIGGLASQLLKMRRRAGELPVPTPVIPGLDGDTDLIISANILSQLALGPLDYAAPRYPFSDEALIQWCQSIIYSHIDSLVQSGSRVCLYSDVVHEKLNLNRQVLSREDMLFGIDLPDSAWNWSWELAPVGELSRNYSIEAQVAGFVNFPWPRH